jgi:hypothetical protein
MPAMASHWQKLFFTHFTQVTTESGCAPWRLSAGQSARGRLNHCPSRNSAQRGLHTPSSTQAIGLSCSASA